MSGRYILRHKDIDVAVVGLNELYGIEQIHAIGAIEHLPPGVAGEEGKVRKKRLEQWWVDRGIPVTRDSYDRGIRELKAAGSGELLAKAMGLNLTDHYWMVPENKAAKHNWANSNFYRNEFSKDIGKLFFYGEQKQEINFMGPDSGSNGNLKKRWEIQNGDRVLVKGGSKSYYQEPFNEVISAELASRLGIDHVPYHLINEGDEYYSICPNMTDEKIEFICALDLYDTRYPGMAVSQYDHYMNCCENANMPPGYKNMTGKMIVLDFLVAATDRHWGNFGVLRDSESLDYTGVAPLFDNGGSLWNEKSTVIMQTGLDERNRCFDRMTNREQLELVLDVSWFDEQKLEGFVEEMKEILMKNPNGERERAEKIAAGFKSRIETIIAKKYKGLA
jgi:hypothetical protein